MSSATDTPSTWAYSEEYYRLRELLCAAPFARTLARYCSGSYDLRRNAVVQCRRLESELAGLVDVLVARGMPADDAQAARDVIRPRTPLVVPSRGRDRTR